MKSNKDFVIPFIGLKLGSHSFQFEVDDTFFEQFEYSTIEQGKVHVELLLEKKETMMIGQFSIEGVVSALCDRCDAPIDVPVSGDYQLIYQFGLEESDDEMLITLHPDSYEVDVKSAIYEFILISLPMRLTHEEGECDEEMVEALSKYLVNPDDESDDDEEDDDDSPFSVLKDLN